MVSWLGRWLVRASAGSALVAALGGIPAFLTMAIGWPLPHAVPDREALTGFLTGGVTDRMVLNLLAVAIWLVWALFAQAVLAELRDIGRGVKDLHPRRHRNPMRTAASLLISSMLLGSVLTATAATANPQPARALPSTPITATAQAVPALTQAAEGPTIVHVGNERYVYTVKRGDYLSKVAKAWLGDASRWPEICDMNRHRHFPKAGGTLRDCNLIYPGWDLRLPADARPPHGATPVKPPVTQTPPPVVTTPTPSTSPSSPAPAVTPSPSITASPAITASPGVDGPVVVPPGVPTTGPASPSPSTSASGSPAASSSSSASVSPAASDAESPDSVDEHGVQLSPSSWLPWGLALAISAAVVLVWLQRRRRFTGQPDDDPPTMLPEPVVRVRRAVARRPELAVPEDTDTQQPPLVPDLAPLPPGGTGVTGDGASAAARAALVAVLASGGPHDPDTRGEVIIDAATLATLLGPDVVTLGAWPRLHVADSIDEALTVIEGWLLHRSRILDEHALTDLDELRQHVPDEESLPPVMLITETPPAGARMRAKVALALGGGLQVTGLLLGEWAHGATIEVAPDGHTKLVAGQSADPIPARLPVLDPAAAIQILTTLREAQTGEPPAIVSPAVPLTVVPLHASRTTVAADDEAQRSGEEQPHPPADGPAAPVATTGPVKAKLRVIGPPRIDGIVHDGRALRAKAKELAVFLAVHPDGVETRTIGDNIELDARISQAAQRVHTNASNLRHVLGRAAVPDAQNAYVVKGGGGYKLDPATVDVDVWTLRDLMRKAAIASGPARRELLTAACDLYTAPLAEGEDYEWLAPHRETVRRWGTEAHLLLADDLLADHHAREASVLLDKAIGLDRYNEALYVRAMHARHGLGDADGIRTLLRALTKALADLDAEPQDDTRTLAAKLRTSLEQR
ncbi:LysM peptidoglycan-binding domain-containing protein [Micromonospora aurantiaca]|uniref:BTAD domain-containing putative transcriptional regulator n=1 Tax=Micromonospora aurantiaca (nom. illeg.) TaxID=47850 RepID=UPI000F41C3D5|nr:BTAD domain-containing putative transcriptional regulator [Micromonospora aurantiaca]RNI00900.1 LysM peptidoglycan-binding domain-containing protein [Micromonospora aurantiaca]